MTTPMRPYCNLSLDDDQRLLRHACLTTLEEAEEEDQHRRTALLNYLEGPHCPEQRDVTSKVAQVLKGIDSGMGCSAGTDFGLRDHLWGLAHEKGNFDSVIVTFTSPLWRFSLSNLPKKMPTVWDLGSALIRRGASWVNIWDFAMLGAILDETTSTVSLSLIVCGFADYAAELRKNGSIARFQSDTGKITGRAYDGDQARKAVAAYALCRPSQPPTTASAIDTTLAGLTVLAWLSQGDLSHFHG